MLCSDITSLTWRLVSWLCSCGLGVFDVFVCALAGLISVAGFASSGLFPLRA